MATVENPDDFPGFISPQLLVDAAAPPEGPGYLHEIKLDGYRLQAHCHKGQVRLYTRSGSNWTQTYQPVANEICRLGDNFIMDGEICVIRNSLSSFSELSRVTPRFGDPDLYYFAFDLLYENGRDLRHRPLRERKKQLRALIPETTARILYWGHFDSDDARDAAMLPTFFARARAHGTEGIVSKWADSVYHSGRSTTWIKSRFISAQDVVVGGFTGSKKIGSLLFGYYEGSGLRYAGKVSAGLTEEDRRDFHAALSKITQTITPFDPAPAHFHNIQWVKPALVVNVTFNNWTSNGLLRFPVYRGWQKDRMPREITRETAPAP